MLIKTYSEHLIERWEAKQRAEIDRFYTINVQRTMINYKSHEDALDNLADKKDRYITDRLASGGKRVLDIPGMVDVLVNTVTFTVISEYGNLTLLTYNYDTQIYEYNESVLNDYIVELMGYSSMQLLKTVIQSLIGKRRYLAIYNPLPKYKIAVGNGIYNALTRQLEEYHPKFTVTNRISTYYKADAKHPIYANGFNLEKMITTFANEVPERVNLLHQVLKSIVTGINISPAIFMFVGSGGDGKSTFFDMVVNMIGFENVAFINFSELNSPDKLAMSLNKKLVIGMDNNANDYLKNTSLLKTIATHEVVTYSRKYLPAISAKFDATFVQLCNQLPRFAETGSSMERRLVIFKAEYSYYEHGTEDISVGQIIKDRNLSEYLLKYILDDLEYYADYNDYDRKIVRENLENEDILGQFVEELYITGILSEVNKNIPTNYLYAMYLDWINKFNSGMKPHASRTFNSKIESYLNKYGYEIMSSYERKYLSEIQNEMMLSSFGEWKEGFKFKEVEDSNTLLRYIKRQESFNFSRQDIRRQDYTVPATYYFGLETELNKFAQSENLNADVKTENVKGESEIAKVETINVEVQTMVQNDIRTFYKNKDKLIKYQKYVLENKPIIEMPPILEQLEHVATHLNDGTLFGKIMQMKSNPDVDLLLEVINYLIKESS